MLLPGARLGMRRMWFQVYAKQWQSLEGSSHPSDTWGGVSQMLPWEVTSYWTATNHQERKTAGNSRLQSHRGCTFETRQTFRQEREHVSSVTFWKWVPWRCCRDHPAAILVMHAASVASSQLSPEPLTSEHLPPLNSEMGGWGLRLWWQSNCIRCELGLRAPLRGRHLADHNHAAFCVKMQSPPN